MDSSATRTRRHLEQPLAPSNVQLRAGLLRLGGASLWLIVAILYGSTAISSTTALRFHVLTRPT